RVQPAPDVQGVRALDPPRARRRAARDVQPRAGPTRRLHERRHGPRALLRAARPDRDVAPAAGIAGTAGTAGLGDDFAARGADRLALREPVVASHLRLALATYLLRSLGLEWRHGRGAAVAVERDHRQVRRAGVLHVARGHV